MRYALVGGLAVSAWAVPRATREPDLWVEMGDGRSELEDALDAAGFDVPAMEAELTRFGVFRSNDKTAGVFVDIFDAAGPLGAAILDNRVQGRVGDADAWIARAEELAVLKMYSDRRRDFDDLVALLRQADVDESSLRSWARQLDRSIGSDEVSERLSRALAEAED